MTNPNPTEVLTHVTHGHMANVQIYAPIGAGKATASEVSLLLRASENVVECIQNGAMFSSDDASIDACVEATDLLEASIATLKAKGF